ncbi:mitochondrial chaperone-like protein [Megavirus courdo7]|nr:mitochondrial chaperone-like protein [Megavirus courdo7]
MCININNILIIPIMGSIISTLTYSLVGGVSYVCYKMTDKVFALIKNSLRNYICSNIQISNGNNSKILYALQQEVEQNVKKTALTNVRDNGVKPVFTLPYGIHKITTKQFGVIYVDYDDKGMKLYNLSKLSVCPPRLRKRTIELQNYIQDVYDKHCIRSQIIVSYTAENDKWSFPIMRRPTQFLKKNYTMEMQQVLSDVHKFKTSQDIYQKYGVNYRRGYLLYGPSGTGKTTIIEIIAKTYNMEFYSVNLNSDNMNDTILINLISKIPPNSIISFEEIDKQIETLDKNNNRKISVGGILTALDGPQRLSHGTIVIMTANNKNFFNSQNMDALLRAGRIDKHFDFKTKLSIDIDI